METLTIGEIARDAEIATSAIRYYEEIGLLPPPARINGRRRYDRSVMRKLGVIRLGQKAGLSIAEIHTMLHGFEQNTPPSARWRQFAAQKMAELDERIAQIEAMKAVLRTTLDCACPSIDDCGASLE